MTFYVPTDEIGRLARGSLQEKLATIARHAVAHLNELDPRIRVTSTVGTFEDKVIVLTETGEAISIPYQVEQEGWSYGLPERIEIRRYSDQTKNNWILDEAMEIASLALDPAKKDQVRNRLRGLSEAVAPGGAYTTEAIIRRLAEGLKRQTWADVYAERAKEIRASIHGQIGKIQESLPKERFRVLATEHTPEDPERFRGKLLEGINAVLTQYESIAARMAVVDVSGARGLDKYIGLAESALIQNLAGFVSSLHGSADAVTKDGRQILVIESEKGEIPRLARLHDLLADGLEDFSVCATFVEQLLGALKHSSSGGISP